jgi:DNA-binding protein H-NS
MKQINLKSMPLDALITLRDRINKMLSSERRQLQSMLSRLDGMHGFDGVGRTKADRPKKRGKVAPKYRNPANRDETWTGRGRQPRWLAAALKNGKDIADFAITHVGKTPKRRQKRSA